MVTKLPHRRPNLSILAFLAMILLLTACSVEQESTLKGRAAPDFSALWLRGGEIRLSDLRGRPVLLEFWAPWCSGCLKNIEPLNLVHEKYGDRIQVIALSAEQGRNTLAAFVKKRGITYPVALSSRKIINDYNAMSIPLTLLIDSDGIIRQQHYGVMQFHHLKAFVEDLL
jgi:cytochrome c biogenesis protein CcmG, thiol:disulfide interchange protein DsbE